MATSAEGGGGASLAFFLLFLGATETGSGTGDALLSRAFGTTSPPFGCFSVETSLSVSLSLDEETADIIQRLETGMGSILNPPSVRDFLFLARPLLLALFDVLCAAILVVRLGWEKFEGLCEWRAYLIGTWAGDGANVSVAFGICSGADLLRPSFDILVLRLSSL
jgi:hypothetical protein